VPHTTTGKSLLVSLYIVIAAVVVIVIVGQLGCLQP